MTRDVLPAGRQRSLGARSQRPSRPPDATDSPNCVRASKGARLSPDADGQSQLCQRPSNGVSKV
eukprot:5672406-Heterocapsa_arctica.AAC.1